MKLYKYSKGILWTLYILILISLIILLFFLVYKKGLISIEFLLTTLWTIIYFTGIRKFIKNLSDDIYAKGYFSEYAQKSLDSLIEQSNNINILPFQRFIVKGLGKNIEELDEKKKIIKVFLRKDDDFNIVKSQISLIIGKYFLPNISKNKLLDEIALESLRLLIAKKINYDQDIINQIENTIKNKEKNYEFMFWLRKWNKIDSLINEIKPQKNILLEFIKPKFENISEDNSKNKQKKLEEINFLIHTFCEDKIVIIFIDDLIDIGSNNKSDFIEYYFRKSTEIIKDKKYIILASRGRNNWINTKVVQRLLEKKGLKLRYNIESDKWAFKDRVVDINWAIIEKMKGT